MAATQKITKIILIAILVLAFFLRVFKLNTVPIELFGDEIDAGYQAYSILKTGHDYYGQFMPILFHSLSEFRLPMMIYSQVPTIALFGLNEWGVRMQMVFWMMLGILGIYLLAKELFGRSVGLISAFLLAISPWHLQYSRQAGIESGILLTFLTFALWAFLKGLKQFSWLLASVVLFGLSFYTYAVGSLFIPLFGVFLLALNYKKVWGYGVKKLVLAIFVGLLILTPYLFVTFFGEATHRSSVVSIFSDKKALDDVVYRRSIDVGEPGVELFHNTVSSFANEFTYNYFQALSPEFLFLRGDPNLRQSVGDRGVFFLFELFLIVLGIYAVIRKEVDFRLLMGWLFLGIIPSSLTIEGGYHASRLMLILVPFTVLAALGVNFLITNRKKLFFKLAMVCLAFLAIINVVNYLNRYYVDWPKDSFRFWHYGYKEAMTYLYQNDKNYSRIYINNTYEPALLRFLFWYRYEPTVFRQQFRIDQPRMNVVEGFEGFKFGEKYFFGGVSSKDKYQGISNLLQQNQLYLVSTRDEAGGADWRVSMPSDLILLKTVVDPLSQPVFYIVTKK